MGPRKHYLDALRVIAFGLLILFHVGCLYASWDFVLKSPRLAPQVDWLLLAINPWRMALLFLISGVASRHLLSRLGPGGLALDRVRRILPPLLVGMFVIIPPQIYVELLTSGVIHEDYLRFWLFSYLPADQTLVAPLHRTMPTYDHLWFIVYLLNYVLLYAAIVGVGRWGARLTGRGVGAPGSAGPSLPLAAWVIAPGLWLVGTIFLIQRFFPQTFWVGNDWGSHLKWGGMFAAGAMLAGREDYWAWVKRWRVSLTVLAVLFLALQSLNRALWLAGLSDPLWSAVGWSVTSGLYAWCMISALLGHAARWLDRPSPWLSHLNVAVLPIYVLHQPALLVAAYLLFPLRLPLTLEAGALVLITLFGTLAIYEGLIRPFGVMRGLFGLKTSV